MFKPRYKVTLQFKSGQSVTIKVREFTVKRDGDKLKQLNWTLVNANAHPMHLDLDQIEAIVSRKVWF